MEKRISAYFYATYGGSEPVRDWLFGLNRPDRYVIGVDIKAIEFGWPRDYHPPTLVKNLEGPISEVRSNLTDGRIARVLFVVEGNKMILLHGFIKKSQKTPRHGLELAKKRLKEYQRSIRYDK